jgi:hypothetical protein
MKRFYEYVSDRDGVVKDPSSVQSDQEDLLKNIVRHHGLRFRSVLKQIIRNGMLDDDQQLLKDIKELYHSIGNAPSEFPPNEKITKREPDVVSRPNADGASGDMPDGGAGGGGGG